MGWNFKKGEWEDEDHIIQSAQEKWQSRARQTVPAGFQPRLSNRIEAPVKAPPKGKVTKEVSQHEKFLRTQLTHLEKSGQVTPVVLTRIKNIRASLSAIEDIHNPQTTGSTKQVSLDKLLEVRAKSKSARLSKVKSVRKKVPEIRSGTAVQLIKTPHGTTNRKMVVVDKKKIGKHWQYYLSNKRGGSVTHIAGHADAYDDQPYKIVQWTPKKERNQSEAVRKGWRKRKKAVPKKPVRKGQMKVQRRYKLYK